MNKIDDLINKLCPDGVEYKSLEKLCGTITTGKLNANAMVEDGDYPFFTCDANPFKIDRYAFDEEAIIISGNGSQVGHINYYNGKFNAYQRTYVLYDFRFVDVRFLLHYLDGYLRKYIMIHSKKGSVPYITLPMLQNFSVPVPPMEVQDEIVCILDNFTELLSLIKEELNMQNDIYNEFVNQCFEKMMIDKNSLVELKEITKAESNKNKNQLVKLAYSITKTGLIPTSEYFGETKITSDDTSNYKIVKPNWFVYSPSRIDIGSINYHKTNEVVIVSPLNVVFSINEDKVDSSYLLYFLKSHKGMFQILSKRTGIEGTGRKLLPYEKFSEIKIPLPSIEKQKEIVEKIKKYDELCNEVLPAEIEARQKQYEYYRDKLLTFKELVNEE